MHTIIVIIFISEINKHNLCDITRYLFHDTQHQRHFICRHICIIFYSTRQFPENFNNNIIRHYFTRQTSLSEEITDYINLHRLRIRNLI